MNEAALSAVREAQRLRSAILERHGVESEADIPATTHSSALEDAARLATVNAHWGIVSDAPAVGRIIVLGKRAIRVGLRWYVNPIVEQQNAFNDASTRALYELQAENDRLRAELNRIDKKEHAE